VSVCAAKKRRVKGGKRDFRAKAARQALAQAFCAPDWLLCKNTNEFI
jgi:hypothetical protein